MDQTDQRASAGSLSRPQSVRLDRQLSRISTLLEKSRLEMGAAKNKEEEKGIKTIFPGDYMRDLVSQNNESLFRDSEELSGYINNY